jgi:hypothetical protein
MSVASPIYRRPPRPPGIYRAARGLRRAALIALVLVLLYVGIVAYSAVEVVKSSPGVGNSSTTMDSNGTVAISTSFTLPNSGFFPIQQFALHFRILNTTGDVLVASTVGPTDIPAGSNQSIPVELYFPLTGGGASLLTENQYLQWQVWGNATYGYLFAISIDIATEKSWGAPFANLSVRVGTPSGGNGSTVVPVSVTFSNDASFSDSGSLDFQVVPASGPDCGQGSFVLNVPSNSPFSQTQNIAVASGCDPSGGHVAAEYVTPGSTVPLPSEAIP